MSTLSTAPPGRGTTAARPTRRLPRRTGDLSVATKILTGIVIAALTSTVVGAVGVAELGAARDARARELSTSLPLITSLNTAALTAKAIANDERGYLLTSGQEYLDEIDERRVALDASLAEAAAASSTAGGREAVDEIEAGIAAWSASVDQEIALLPTDRDAALARAFETTRPLRKTYEGSFASAIAAAEEDLLAGEDFARDIAAARRAMVVAAVLGAAAALGVGVWAARSTTRRLRRVGVLAEALERGDLTGSTGVHDRDEVGRVASSLDAAVTALRGVMTSVAGAAAAERTSGVVTLTGASFEALEGRAAELGEQVSRFRF